MDEGWMPEADARAVVRLLSDAIEFAGDLPGRKRVLLRGLASLVGADAWYAAMLRVMDSGGEAVPLELLHEGFTPAQLAAYTEGRDDRQRPPAELAALRVKYDQSNGRPFTCTRQDLVDDVAWYASEHYRHYAPMVGVDQFMFANDPVADEQLCVVWGFFRHLGGSAFGERERRLAHLVLSESRWLRRDRLSGEVGDGVASLSPRYRTVLRLLLEGMTEKEIARHLHRSPHTVHEYVKAIYRALRVTSRSELIRRFTTGEVAAALQ